MALVRHDALVDDPYVAVAAGEPVPSEGAVLVDLETWESARSDLLGRQDPIGVRLRSDQTPEAIADDLHALDLVALEFPAFRDGRAYSYARMLRERFGFDGEIRAVGDVLMEQLHFMLRTGFDSFEIQGDDPLGQYRRALAEFSIWYQPTGDGRSTAMQRRHAR